MDAKQLNVVLLAAGRGSRIAELTEHTHKSLLPVGGCPCLQLILDAVLQGPVEQVVVVTGYMADTIEEVVARHHPDRRIRIARNPDYARDTNIRSVDIGVEALDAPERGYLIVETDIVVEPDAWRSILAIDPGGPSTWVTRGSYSAGVTGGALRANGQSKVERLVYAPEYDRRYEGWQKLLGILFVGGGEAATDRRLRREALEHTMKQYYMTPWCVHLAELPCEALSLGERFAHSFNDLASYQSIKARYEEVAGIANSSPGSAPRKGGVS